MRLTTMISISTFAFVAACAAPGPVDPSLVTSITVNPGQTSVPAGGAQRFTAIALDAQGDPLIIPLIWTSSNPGVAIVDENGRATHLAPGTTLIRATAANGVFGEATLTVTATGFCTPSPDAGEEQNTSGVLYMQGFEAGPISSENTPGLRITPNPNALLDWQSAVYRTGHGAYRLRGGDVQGDATIHNQPTSHPFGGLEVWAGGAFCFVSFPDPGPGRATWLIATVPTDGILGAGDKPVAAITASGTLELRGSNSVGSSEIDFSLQTHRWYYILVHGRNGTTSTQELYLYDGTTGDLLGRTSIVLDVTGTFRDPITKWGFGTSQDSSGLEYYLDDIVHASGGINPGPIRVRP